MTEFRPRRSVLYMPGSNPRVLQKAKTLPVDGLILDLEDAVAPESKVGARENIANAVAEKAYGSREVIIRINGLDTEWGKEDMEMAAKAAPDAILVPKISSAADVRQACAAMISNGAPAETKLWAMIETPLAMVNLKEIAECAKDPSMPIACFVLGTNDLAKETTTSVRKTRRAMVPWLSMTVAAARAFGLIVLDGVYNDFQNVIGYREECIQGKDLGMDGKTLIHPSQIRAANEMFAPDPEEVRWSKKLISAFEQPENKGKGAIAVEGRMFELHHAEIAKKVVAQAEAIQRAEDERAS